MNNLRGTLVAAAVLVWGMPLAAQPVPSAQSRALLDKYCLGCHNNRMKAGALVLDAASMNVDNVAEQQEAWERVLRKVRVRSMPPAGTARPDETAYTALTNWLTTALDATTQNPGRTSIHRLNRNEYANAIRDLLAVDLDVKTLLPADTSSFGFDNMGDILSISPALLERYMSAAQAVAAQAIGDPSMGPDVVRLQVPWMTDPQDERLSEDLPFGSRGGASLSHYFPVDGEYLIKVRLQRHQEVLGGNVRGLDVVNRIDVRLDDTRLKLFVVGGKPAGGVGSAASISVGATRDGAVDWDYEVRVPIRAGSHTLSATLNHSNWYHEGIGPPRLPLSSHGFSALTTTTPTDGRVDMGIDSMQIEGPFNPVAPRDTASRRRIFICSQEDLSCARSIVTTLARRAYRRPVSAAETKPLMAFFEQGRSLRGFDGGIQSALERILVSPQFLYRIERDPSGVKPGEVYPVSDLDLASRLSFFLWSSIPDDELISVAAAGQLRAPASLERQVRRMLADKRSEAFIANFFGQWLFVRNVALTKPDPKEFPEFDERLRDAFEKETELFLRSQIREDRNILELLSANYTFMNERLARHYGVPNVYGSHFRRVTYPDDRRAGLLGHGSFLTVQAYPNRTSVVLRGKWLLENVLGTPPGSPPPNVPPFPENDASAPTTVRERMEQHRRNPVCAACHAQMDPLGFALENFDAVGKWRDTEAGKPVDASGVLPGGAKFDGPAAMRAGLLRYSEAFEHTLTEKLLTYALGRGVEYYDMPAVRKIVRETSAQGGKWSSLVLAIVRSTPFQMRRAES